MKAVRYHTYGDPSVLQYEEVDRPTPAPGQVLVRVAATSFNPADVGIRAGYMQQVLPIQLPHTPGLDVAGTVAELGPAVTGFSIGDPVFGFPPMTENGAAAEYVIVPAEVLVAAPTSIPLTEAAAVPTAALTAWQVLFDHANLEAGQRILVNGAGGGVGSFAVQFASQVGAFVIATASRRSAQAVHDLGADEVVDYTSTTVTEAVTDPVDVVVNLVSASDEQMVALVGLVRPGGVLVTTTGPATEDTERKVRGISMYVHSDTDQLAAIAARIDAGTLRTNVTDTYSLSDLAKVHELSAAGGIRGKVIIVPS